MDLWPFSPHFSGKLLCKKKVSNSWFQFQEERWLLMGNIGNLWTLPAHQFRWGTREDLSLGDLGGDLIGFSGFQHPTLSEKRTRSKLEGSWSIFLVQPWTWNMSRTDISYDFICNVHVNVYIYIQKTIIPSRVPRALTSRLLFAPGSSYFFRPKIKASGFGFIQKARIFPAWEEARNDQRSERGHLGKSM